jgi:hypothetical protein
MGSTPCDSRHVFLASHSQILFEQCPLDSLRRQQTREGTALPFSDPGCQVIVIRRLEAEEFLTTNNISRKARS